MFKKSSLVIIAMTSLVVAKSYANNLDDMAAGDLYTTNQFQKFDDQISLGNSWSNGTISDGINNTTFNSSSVMLSASKLFRNQIYLAAGGQLAYSSNLINYSGNTMYAQLGYAFAPAQIFQIIPLVSIARGQMSAFSQDGNMNDVYGSATAGLRFELLASSQIKFNFDVSGGAYTQNGTISQSDPSTVNGGLVNAGASLNLRPISNVPWIISVGYDYTNYSGAILNSNSNLSLSTGYTY